MTLESRAALAQKLDALVFIGRDRGWFGPEMRLLATPNRTFRETGVYVDDTANLLALRCGVNVDSQGDSIHLHDRRTGWDDDRPFLLIMAAMLVLDGHAYHAQVSLPSGVSPVADTPGIGSAHERMAVAERMMAHLGHLGWLPGMRLDTFHLLEAATTAIANALPSCR